MKKLAAILFFLIMVFNFYGYRMVIDLLERESEIVMEKKLNRHEYADQELFSFKIKLNLPYYTSSPVYERSYGSVSIEGIVYEYVKRRVFQDTLELLCIPSMHKTKLQQVNNDLAKMSADGPASAPIKKAPVSFKISLPDFFQQPPTILSALSCQRNKYFFQNESFILPGFSSPLEHPPQTV